MTMDGVAPIEVYKLYSPISNVRVMPHQALKSPHIKVTIFCYDSFYLEIQTALVELEDKEKSIIGSSQWIGAFEVNLCV
jgi:hypothetical protein